MSAIVWPSPAIFAFREASGEHVALALRLHGEAVDGIFDLGLRIGVEMTKTASKFSPLAREGL
ncbi:MAG: hypothetical protein ACREFQ_21415 [Stellaceae bacterium]